MAEQFTAEVCVADDGLINPAAFPCKSEDLDTNVIANSGSKVVAIGTGVLSAAEDAQTAWNGLQAPGVFESPDQDAVYTLMQPAVDGAKTMNGVTTRIGNAITTYADELAGIKPKLADLEGRAAEFRARALQGYEVSSWEANGWMGTLFSPGDWDETKTISWSEHGPAVEQNTALVHEYNQILESISTAASTCANAIQAELTMVCVAPAEPVTAEMLDAATDFSSWGHATEEDRNCTESVGHGLGTFWHGTWTGAASLIGRNPTTGDWDWGVAGQSWLGVGDFVLSTVIVVAPGVNIAAAAMSDGDSGFSNFLNNRFNTAIGSWGSLIGWDQQAHLAGENGWHKWEEDGVAAGTESVANIGTFFIPVAGWASGTAKTVFTGTRVGSFVVKVGTHLSEVIIPAGSHLAAGVVKVVDLGANGVKGGWKGLIDALKSADAHPSGVPGVVNSATGQPHLGGHTPVSDELGLHHGNGAAHGSGPRVPGEGNASTPGGQGSHAHGGDAGAHTPNGEHAPNDGDTPAGNPEADGSAADQPAHTGEDGSPGGTDESRHPEWKYDDPQVQEFQSELEAAVARNAPPGYDPTGGLGWQGFFDEYLLGFDHRGNPSWRWPADPPHTNGFLNGISQPSDLAVGDRLERITFVRPDGTAADGSFAAPRGTRFDQLALPPDRLGDNTTVVHYEVVKPLPDSVRTGDIAPGFHQPGAGIQYYFPDGIREFVTAGYLKEVSS